MAELHVVTALTAKRAEMAGLIAHHQKQIAKLSAELHHLDITLKLFAPDLDLRTMRAKTYRVRNTYFRRGELPRFILDSLRRHGAALTSRELADQALLSKHLENTPESVAAMQNTLLQALHRLEKTGTVVVDQERAHGRTWRIA